MRFSGAAVLLWTLVLGRESAAKNRKEQSEWTGWTCDDLAPISCTLQEEIGEVTMRGGVQVRYWRYRRDRYSPGGDGSTQSGDAAQRLPIIMLHGGPGWPHYYMRPLRQRACFGREVIFYDQAGSGESPINAPAAEAFPWLLDPQYYARDELPTLISHLGIGGGYHLVGHSWGTLLAQLFALDAPHTDGSLASMVLSGPFSDSYLFLDEQWDETTGTLGTLPPFVQSRIRALNSERAFDSAEYKAIDDVLTTFFTCRTAPLPDCVEKSNDGLNREIYVAMQGPSEFDIGGTLDAINTTSRLKELSMPVLLTSGRFDTMTPAVVDVMYTAIPLSECIVFMQSGHVSMADQPVAINGVFSSFFDRVEAAQSCRDEICPEGSNDQIGCHRHKKLRRQGNAV